MPHPEKVDRYIIEGIIGRGAMGVVYRARDERIGRVVALKTVTVPGDMTAEERSDAMERFCREARAAGRLSHPNIVTLFDFVEAPTEGGGYIAMEMVEGRSLRQILSEGPLPSERCLDVAMQMGRALDCAHRQMIVHRDVKPANILLRADGLAKLTDFGIARVESSDLTRTGESVGSPSYIAPETLLNRPVDGRTDLFSLGVVLYECLTGEKPFRAENVDALYRKILTEDPAPPTRLDPSIPGGWDAIVMRLLAKNPEDRYQSGTELLRDLRLMEEGRPMTSSISVEQPTPATGARSYLPPHRKAMLAFLTITGFALAITFLTVLIQGKDAHTAANDVNLAIHLEHSLDRGRFTLVMDGKIVIDEAFEGRPVGRRYRGTELMSVTIPPGKHRFDAVVIDAEGVRWDQALERDLTGGTESTLLVELKGTFRRRLELSWF